MPKTRHAAGRTHGGAADSIDEKLTSGFDGSELQILLGAKVGKKTALAHFQVIGEAADGEAFETFERSEMNGAQENRFASAEAAGLATRRGFAWDAGGEGHEGIVTQNK
jgi:hypothetical protein